MFEGRFLYSVLAQLFLASIYERNNFCLIRFLRAFVGLHVKKEGISFGSLLSIILAYGFLLGFSQRKWIDRSWLFLGLCVEMRDAIGMCQGLTTDLIII